MQKTIRSRLSDILSRYFVQIRKEAGLTQREMGKLIGKAYSTITRIEQGERRVDMAEFFLICRALRLNPQKEAVRLLKLLSKSEK